MVKRAIFYKTEPKKSPIQGLWSRLCRDVSHANTGVQATLNYQTSLFNRHLRPIFSI